jgi:hypothetical protein
MSDTAKEQVTLVSLWKTRNAMSNDEMIFDWHEVRVTVNRTGHVKVSQQPAASHLRPSESALMTAKGGLDIVTPHSSDCMLGKQAHFFARRCKYIFYAMQSLSMPIIDECPSKAYRTKKRARA